MAVSNRFKEKWQEQTQNMSPDTSFLFSCGGLSCMECAFRYASCARAKTKAEWEKLIEQSNRLDGLCVADEIVSTVSPDNPEFISAIHITENSITIDTPTHTYTEKDLSNLTITPVYHPYLIRYAAPEHKSLVYGVYSVYVSAVNPAHAEAKFRDWSLGKGTKILSIVEGIYNYEE